MAYRFVRVCHILLASSDGEVVELDVFEGVYFVEPCLDPVADLEVWVKGVGLGPGFLLTDFLPFGSLRCSSASLPRWSPGFFFLVSYPLLFFLLSAVLLS